MMRTSVVALLAAASTPAAAETLWFGEGIVTAATAPCGTSIAPGDFAKVTYRPTGAALNNGPDSYLSWVSSRSSHTLQVPGGSFRAGVNYKGFTIGSKAAASSKSGGILAFSATTGPSTDITLTATFANFYTITGCTVSLSGALLPLP